MQFSKMNAAVRIANKTVIGWREWVALPQLGIERLKTKIDTGARTSALHATGIKLYRIENRNFVDFFAPGSGEKAGRRQTALLLDQRPIRNTSGQVENRLIIQTELVIAGRSWPIEVSLTDRKAMTFDFILGRTAIRNRHLLVDPGRSFLCEKPGKTVRPH